MLPLTSAPADPAPDCDLCPRLVAFRKESQLKNPDWFNGAVGSFGDPKARLLIVGLAPGLTGANRTARPFTGDFAGDLLYQTLAEFGFSTGTYDKRADDGVILNDCRITNAVRCVPPQNKPVGAEVNTCRPFLVDEIAAMPNLKVILALGGLAHGAVIQTLGERKSAWKFGHCATHDVPGQPLLINSYHCSRYNTNTGRLTTEMFADVFALIAKHLD